MSKYMHEMCNGVCIPLPKLSDQYLNDILRKITQMARDGIYVKHDGIWGPKCSFEEVVYGEVALDVLHYGDYLKELYDRLNAEAKEYVPQGKEIVILGTVHDAISPCCGAGMEKWNSYRRCTHCGKVYKFVDEEQFPVAIDIGKFPTEDILDVLTNEAANLLEAKRNADNK